jgi:hypothetical protein
MLRDNISPLAQGKVQDYCRNKRLVERSLDALQDALAQAEAPAFQPVQADLAELLPELRELCAEPRKTEAAQPDPRGRLLHGRLEAVLDSLGPAVRAAQTRKTEPPQAGASRTAGDLARFSKALDASGLRRHFDGDTLPSDGAAFVPASPRPERLVATADLGPGPALVQPRTKAAVDASALELLEDELFVISAQKAVLLPMSRLPILSGAATPLLAAARRQEGLLRSVQAGLDWARAGGAAPTAPLLAELESALSGPATDAPAALLRLQERLDRLLNESPAGAQEDWVHAELARAARGGTPPDPALLRAAAALRESQPLFTLARDRWSAAVLSNLAALPEFKDGTPFAPAELGLSAEMVGSGGVRKSARSGRAVISYRSPEGFQVWAAPDGSYRAEEVTLGERRLVLETLQRDGGWIQTLRGPDGKAVGEDRIASGPAGRLSRTLSVDAEGNTEAPLSADAPGLSIGRSPEGRVRYYALDPWLFGALAKTGRPEELDRAVAALMMRTEERGPAGGEDPSLAQHKAESISAFLRDFLRKDAGAVMERRILFLPNRSLHVMEQTRSGWRELFGSFEATWSGLSDTPPAESWLGLGLPRSREGKDSLGFSVTARAGKDQESLEKQPFRRLGQYIGSWALERPVTGMRLTDTMSMVPDYTPQGYLGRLLSAQVEAAETAGVSRGIRRPDGSYDFSRGIVVEKRVTVLVSEGAPLMSALGTLGRTAVDITAGGASLAMAAGNLLNSVGAPPELKAELERQRERLLLQARADIMGCALRRDFGKAWWDRDDYDYGEELDNRYGGEHYIQNAPEVFARRGWHGTAVAAQVALALDNNMVPMLTMGHGAKLLGGLGVPGQIAAGSLAVNSSVHAVADPFRTGMEASRAVIGLSPSARNGLGAALQAYYKADPRSQAEVRQALANFGFELFGIAQNAWEAKMARDGIIAGQEAELRRAAQERLRALDGSPAGRADAAEAAPRPAAAPDAPPADSLRGRLARARAQREASAARAASEAASAPLRPAPDPPPKAAAPAPLPKDLVPAGMYRDVAAVWDDLAAGNAAWGRLRELKGRLTRAQADEMIGLFLEEVRGDAQAGAALTARPKEAAAAAAYMAAAEAALKQAMRGALDPIDSPRPRPGTTSALARVRMDMGRSGPGLAPELQGRLSRVIDDVTLTRDWDALAAERGFLGQADAQALVGRLLDEGIFGKKLPDLIEEVLPTPTMQKGRKRYPAGHRETQQAVRAALQQELLAMLEPNSAPSPVEAIARISAARARPKLDRGPDAPATNGRIYEELFRRGNRDLPPEIRDSRPAGAIALPPGGTQDGPTCAAMTARNIALAVAKRKGLRGRIDSRRIFLSATDAPADAPAAGPARERAILDRYYVDGPAADVGRRVMQTAADQLGMGLVALTRTEDILSHTRGATGRPVYVSIRTGDLNHAVALANPRTVTIDGAPRVVFDLWDPNNIPHPIMAAPEADLGFWNSPEMKARQHSYIFLEELEQIFNQRAWALQEASPARPTAEAPRPLRRSFIPGADVDEETALARPKARPVKLPPPDPIARMRDRILHIWDSKFNGDLIEIIRERSPRLQGKSFAEIDAAFREGWKDVEVVFDASDGPAGRKGSYRPASGSWFWARPARITLDASLAEAHPVLASVILLHEYMHHMGVGEVGAALAEASCYRRLLGKLDARGGSGTPDAATLGLLETARAVDGMSRAGVLPDGVAISYGQSKMAKAADDHHAYFQAKANSVRTARGLLLEIDGLRKSGRWPPAGSTPAAWVESRIRSRTLVMDPAIMKLLQGFSAAPADRLQEDLKLLDFMLGKNLEEAAKLGF